MSTSLSLCILAQKLPEQKGAFRDVPQKALFGNHHPELSLSEHELSVAPAEKRFPRILSRSLRPISLVNSAPEIILFELHSK